MRRWRHNLCELRLVRRNFYYVIGISGILPYTQECYLTFAWLYNAAASPASRFRSAASLAIITMGGRHRQKYGERQ